MRAWFKRVSRPRISPVTARLSALLSAFLSALVFVSVLAGLQGCISDYSDKYLLLKNPPFTPVVKTVEPRLENSVFTCWNGIDDDLDGAVDCADDDCKAIMVKCNPPDSIRIIPIPLVENTLDR